MATPMNTKGKSEPKVGSRSLEPENLEPGYKHPEAGHGGQPELPDFIASRPTGVSSGKHFGIAY